MILDIQIDQECAPNRPLPSRSLSPLFVWHTALSNSVLALILAALASEQKLSLSNVPFVGIFCLLLALGVMHIVGRFNKVVSELLLSLMYSSAIWLPALVAEHAICQQSGCSLEQTWTKMDVWPLALVYFLFHMYRDTVLDIADRGGDEVETLWSLATKFSPPTACAVSFMVLLVAAVPAVLVHLAVWHAEWPSRSKNTFVASTCALVLVSMGSTTYLGVSVSKNKPADLDSEQAPSSSDLRNGKASKVSSYERSRVRRLMKLQFIAATLYNIVNIIVGY